MLGIFSISTITPGLCILIKLIAPLMGLVGSCWNRVNRVFPGGILGGLFIMSRIPPVYSGAIRRITKRPREYRQAFFNFVAHRRKFWKVKDVNFSKTVCAQKEITQKNNPAIGTEHHLCLNVWLTKLLIRMTWFLSPPCKRGEQEILGRIIKGGLG